MAYNTTPFHGKAARVEKNNVAMGYGNGWSIDAEVDAEAFRRSGQNWEEVLGGWGRWSGQFGGQFVAGNTEQKAFFDNIIAASPGTILTDVKFLLDGSTNAITGNILVTGLSVSPSVNGVTEFTVRFRGSGAPTLTDAA